LKKTQQLESEADHFHWDFLSRWSCRHVYWAL